MVWIAPMLPAGPQYEASLIPIYLGLTHKRREAEFATVLVPLLVVMLDGERTDIHARKDVTPDERFILERAPAILATLTVDSLDLQRAVSHLLL